MGLDKYNVNRGKCKEEGCPCQEYQRVKDGSRCHCSHVATKHATREEEGGDGNWSSPYSLDVDPAICCRCNIQYSELKHGSCIICYTRNDCLNDNCGELAYYDKELGSFNYCSPECRDKHVLKDVNKELKRALNEFEIIPNAKGSTAHMSGWTSSHDQTPSGSGDLHTPTTEATVTVTTCPTSSSIQCHIGRVPESAVPVSTTSAGTANRPYNASDMVSQASQPTTSKVSTVSRASSSTHGGKDNMSTMEKQFSNSCTQDCSRVLVLPAHILYSTVTTFYDDARVTDEYGKIGILVSALTMMAEASGLQIFDLITRVDRVEIKEMGGYDGKVERMKLTKRSEPSLSVTRKYNIPPMAELGKLGFLSKLRVNKYVAGTFCTSKDLENLTQFLGVVMDDHDQKKIKRVTYDNIGYKIGLKLPYTIVSVAMITSGGRFIGPEHKWSFSSIKSAAQTNPDVCALLLFLEWK